MLQNRICALATTPEGAWAASAGKGERQIALWNLAHPAKRKKSNTAAATVTSRDPPVQLALGSDGGSELANVQETASQSFLLGAVSVTGNATVWECTPSAGAAVETTLRAEVSPASLPDGSR